MRRLVLVTMCAGYFLVLLDVTIVNVALPSIAGGLGAGSLACGAAPSSGALVAARVVQGVGAACLLPGTLAIITRAFPAAGEQARAIGVWAAVGSIALPAGPLVGGALIAAVGWRAVFLVNVPIVVVAGVVAARVTEETVERTGRRIDARGAVLTALTLALLTFAFVDARGGINAPVIVAAVACVTAAIALVGVERRSADPMLPVALLRRPSFATANAVAGAMNLGTLGLLFVLTLYLQSVQGRTALAAGVALLPLFLPLSLLAPLTGRLTARIGPRVPMAAGLLACTAGALVLTALGAGSPYTTLLPALLLWGGGLGLLTPAVVAAAMGAAPGDRAGLASATNNTARQAGGAIGIAAFGAIAGPPHETSAFIAGLHTTALIAAALWLAATGATLGLIRRGAPA